MAKATILIIEDNPDIRDLWSYSLAKEGWSLFLAADAEAGIAALPSINPDCVVLDTRLAGTSALEVLQALRSDPLRKRLPVIVIADAGEAADIAAGIDPKADDLVARPVSPKFLAARIRAALRRTMNAPSRSIRIEKPLVSGDIRLDSARHEVLVKGRIIPMSANDFALLEFFMLNPGWVFSRSQIIEALKGKDYSISERAVDVRILSLRRKLGESGCDIETVRGFGYRIKG
jgi:two-component system alkaline phosphatase synthesis response regulator PhoP